MKKLKRITLNDVAKNVGGLLSQAQQCEIIGGTYDCTVQAVRVAANSMGICLEYSAVLDKAIDVIMDELKCTKFAAYQVFAAQGLTHSQTNTLYDSVFGGTSGSCYNEYSSGTSLVSYLTGMENGKEITHAGVVVREEGNMMLIRTHDLGEVWVPISDRRMCYYATGINDDYQCEGSYSW